MLPYTIPADHKIIDGPTVHASRSLKVPLTGIVDEIPPVLDHQASTPCAWHVVFSSSILHSEHRLFVEQTPRSAYGLILSFQRGRRCSQLLNPEEFRRAQLDLACSI
jgi:hypothetical protein